MRAASYVPSGDATATGTSVASSSARLACHVSMSAGESRALSSPTSIRAVTPGDRPVPSGPFHEKVPHAMARTTLTLGSPA